MAKKMLIDATHAEETRVVVVDGNKVEEFDFESENKRQLAGNIYLAKVTRVEPSLQAAFVDYGGNRHGFLAFSEIHPDYYQIPVADRQALLEEERAYAQELEDEEERPRSSRRSRSRTKPEKTASADAVESRDVAVSGMDVIELDDGGADTLEGHSPMDLVEDTPVEEPENGETGSADATADEETPESAEKAEDGGRRREAAEKDDEIESVADEDVSEEIRLPRKRRPKKYKIQEVIKVRQILLVQVVKEERGNKGAALTTYLSLAGRYCVLMPNTARGGGISRKITNAVDRKKLKDIAGEIEVPDGAGLIIRTAGAKRTKAEIKRDYEYLQRLWEEIRSLTMKSIAPAKIYEEGNLIKRSIRDLYNRDIDEVLVEGEAGYRTAKDFMKMIMPSHARNVKHYADPLPLFARYQVESYLASMFNPVVQLKSGGYIVIGVTEALVAIDVNSGRATKEGSIEETALKTNLEAAEEVARQLRLRDLAGLIVIDFIDMEERRNNAAVEKRLKDRLKTDRARIQVGRISGFGLLEMSRQRLRPGMLEATTQPCAHCHGTGLVRSDDNLALNILRQLEEEGVRRRTREVLLKAPVGIVNFLVNSKREHVAQIESRYGMSIRIEADPFLISPDFSIEKFKTATRAVPEVSEPVVSAEAVLMDEVDEAELDEAPEVSDEAGGEETAKPKKRRRRRRRSRSKSPGGSGETSAADKPEDAEGEVGAADADADAEAGDETPIEAETAAQDVTEAEAAPAEEKPKSSRSRSASSRSRAKSTSKTKAKTEKTEAETPAAAGGKAETPAAEGGKAEPAEAEAEVEAEAEAEKPKPKPKASRSRKTTSAKTSRGSAKSTKKAGKDAEPEPQPGVPEEPVKATETAPAPEPAAAAVEPAPEPKPEPEPEAGDKPKKRGWWSLGG
jgi:ribonuclease E